MTRPMYETEADKAAESLILTAFGERFNANWRPTPRAYPFDACMTRGDRVVAFAEVKNRKVRSDQYPTLHLSAHKWRDLVLFSDTMTVPVMLVVGYTDGVIRFLKVNRDILPAISFGGRADRGDSQDREPVVELNNFVFDSFFCETLSKDAGQMTQ